MPTLTSRITDRQERAVKHAADRVPNAATRNVDLMAQELATLGYISRELWAMALDEEDTHAAELLPAQDEMAYATVPRFFRLENGDLVDKHQQSLRQVLDGGVEHMQNETLAAPGAEWELRRRQAERNNLDTIIDMPAGSVCVEISASPFDKPQNEREAQHYTELTMIRASFKSQDNRVDQYNYVLPLSSPEFLQAVQSKLGRQSNEQFFSSEELLSNPIVTALDESPKIAAKQFDSLLGAALLEVSVGQSAVRMVSKAIENRRETWQFITSEANSDLHNELKAAMADVALLPPAERARAMDAVRSGFWKELKDRFGGRRITAQVGGVIYAAASRAVVDGDVFIACGSTVRATEFAITSTAGATSTAAGRAEVVKTLRKEVIGSGSCSACGAKGKLFGCGLCGGCNKKWCDIYEQTGKQTEIKDLAYLSYSRPEEKSAGETLLQYWQRIGQEIKQKREAIRARELATIKLVEEQKKHKHLKNT